MTQRAKGLCMAITAPCMWGIMGLFIRTLSGFGFRSLDLAFFRCSTTVLLLFFYLRKKNPGALNINRRGLVLFLLFGAVVYGISFVSYGFAISRIPVAVATVLSFLNPVWVALLSVPLFGEKLTTRRTLIILSCLLGAALAANLRGSMGGTMDVLGLLGGLVNGFAVALYAIVPKYFAERYERDTILFYSFLGATLVYLPFVNYRGLVRAIAAPQGGVVLANILGIGVLCTFVANVFYVKSTQYVGTGATSVLSSLEIVVGTSLGFFVFHEALLPTQLIGVALILCAAIGPETIWKARKHTPDAHTGTT